MNVVHLCESICGSNKQTTQIYFLSTNAKLVLIQMFLVVILLALLNSLLMQNLFAFSSCSYLFISFFYFHYLSCFETQYSQDSIHFLSVRFSESIQLNFIHLFIHCDKLV